MTLEKDLVTVTRKNVKHDETIATHAGRHPMENHGVVNPPVYHASTIVFPTLEEFDERGFYREEPGQVVYGLGGTPTTFALEQAMCELEGCYGCVVLPSGLAAVAMAILAFVKSGDHVLVADSVYEPSRVFCDTVLSGLGVEATFYDPQLGADIEHLIRSNTKIVYLESPGSLTFEVQDVPAIADAAHRHGAKVLLDNTWATPIYFKAFGHGVDVCIYAGTKFIAGHSDTMSGLITVTEDYYGPLRKTALGFGQCAGPDDTYMVLRGIRTLPTRLRQHAKQGLEVAQWLQGRAEVAQVLHPALPDCPGHELWQRDFTGASSLFGVVLEECPRHAVASMLDGLEVFALGASWGGYESLVMPAYPQPLRTATSWRAGGPLLRVHVGLENTQDLIEDLERGLARLKNRRPDQGV